MFPRRFVDWSGLSGDAGPVLPVPGWLLLGGAAEACRRRVGWPAASSASVPTRAVAMGAGPESIGTALVARTPVFGGRRRSTGALSGEGAGLGLVPCWPAGLGRRALSPVRRDHLRDQVGCPGGRCRPALAPQAAVCMARHGAGAQTVRWRDAGGQPAGGLLPRSSPSWTRSPGQVSQRQPGARVRCQLRWVAWVGAAGPGEGVLPATQRWDLTRSQRRLDATAPL